MLSSDAPDFSEDENLDLQKLPIPPGSAHSHHSYSVQNVNSVHPDHTERFDGDEHQALVTLRYHADQVQRTANLATIYLSKPPPALSLRALSSEDMDAVGSDEVSENENEGYAESAKGNSTVIGFHYLDRAHEHALKMLEAGDEITTPTSRWATQGQGGMQAACVTRGRMQERLVSYNTGRVKFERQVKEWEQLRSLQQTRNEQWEEQKNLRRVESAKQDMGNLSGDTSGDTSQADNVDDVSKHRIRPLRPGFWFQ